MALKFQTKTTLATSQSAVDGVSVRTPIHSTQPHYTVNLKVADGACTWQQEHVWLSSSSAQEVNMLQKCATCQQLCFCCWTAHIGGGWGEKKKSCRCIFPMILFWFQRYKNQASLRGEGVTVWQCEGAQVGCLVLLRGNNMWKQVKCAEKCKHISLLPLSQLWINLLWGSRRALIRNITLPLPLQLESYLHCQHPTLVQIRRRYL